MAKRLGELDVGTDVVAADKILVQQSAVDKQVVVSELPLPLNYIAGMITSNDTDTDHDIAIAAGIARSADDATNMVLAAILTKQIDAAWAVGDDAGGMDTGAVAVDTMYAVWLIKRSDTGVVDALFSTSFSAPTMPTNYDRKRLIGAVITEGSSNIIQFRQSGDYFALMTFITDISDSTIVDETAETAALSVPPNCLAHIFGSLSNSTETSSQGHLYITETGFTGAFAAGSAFVGATFGGSTFDGISKDGVVLVDGSSEIRYAATETAGAALVIVRTHGFTMLTRSNP